LAKTGQLPAALDGGALKTKEQSPLTGFATETKQDDAITKLTSIDSTLSGEIAVTESSWPADYPDSAVAALLGGGLPADLGGEGGLKVEEQSWPSTYDVSDRAVRLLGVIYGSQGQKLQQKASTYELLVDPVDRAARLLGKVYGSQDVLQQRATSKELIVQIQHQGSEKDPTQIRALTNVDVVSGEVTKWGGTEVTGRDISLDLKAMVDDTIKGVMRTLGDPGAAPEDASGETVLKLLDRAADALEKIDDWDDGANKCRISDGGGAITVDDGGGSLTIDNMYLSLMASSLGVMDDWEDENQVDKASVVPYGSLSQTLQQKAGTYELLVYDNAIADVFNAIGDAGSSPYNVQGETMLAKLEWITDYLEEMMQALYSRNTDSFMVKERPPNAFSQHRKTVAALGTPEALAAAEEIRGIWIEPMAGNTGTVHIGDSSNQYSELYAGRFMSVSDPSLIYVKVSVSGEGVDWHKFKDDPSKYIV